MATTDSRNRFKTGITSQDKEHLAKIIENDLILNGLPPEEIPINSSIGRIIQSFDTLMDRVSIDFPITARESSIPHAQRTTSLINQLIQHQDEITLATPSTIEMFVRLPLMDVVYFGERVQANTWELKYTDKNRVQIDDLIFMPEYPEYILRVTRLVTGEFLPKVYLRINDRNEEVLVQTVFTEGIRLLGFKAKFKQIEIEETPLNFSDDQLDKFIITSEKPIHDIDIFYRDTNASEWRQIKKRPYFTRGSGEYLEYRPIAINKIQIDHKYVQGGFRPIVGGHLKVIKYVTTGRDVKVINYPGAALPLEPDVAVTKISYEPVGVDYFESTGGKLATVDIEALRSRVIQLKGSRLRIDTETDLKTYLRTYPGYTKFEPRLTRNDIKSRIFSVYSTLSFRSDYGTSQRIFTVPTNSGILTVNPANMPKKIVRGFTFYTMNSKHAIKSTQTRTEDFHTLDHTKDPMVDTFPNGDITIVNPSNPSENSYTFYYITPFIISFDPVNSMCRTYADSQYDVPYLSFSTYDNINDNIPARFINTSIRVNDYLDYVDTTNTTTKYVFQLNAQIRCEAYKEYEPLLDTTFKAVIKFVDINNQPKYIKCMGIIMEDQDIYDLVFPLKTDRLIGDRVVSITYTNAEGQEETTDMDVYTQMELEMSIIIPAKTDPQNGAILEPEQIIKTNSYKADVEIFKEVSDTCYLQTNITKDGLFRFLQLPMVMADFYKLPRNRKNIVQEIENISKFIKTEVYDELDEYTNHGYTLKDRLENNFSVSVKFTKTYGLSKFLDIGNTDTTRSPVVNLQVKPTIHYRLVDQDFDLTSIASELNSKLITHDYFQDDYHLNGIVFNTLYDAGTDVKFLEVVNLDKYPPNYLKLTRNSRKAFNWDPPEVLSIAPEYSPLADNYFFKVNFVKI